MNTNLINKILKAEKILKILQELDIDLDDVLDFLLIQKTRHEDTISLDDYKKNASQINEVGCERFEKVR